MSEQTFNVYTYASGKGVAWSTGTYGKEWIGRCPNPQCSSQHDAFSVQPEGKGTGWWAGYGAWKCRKCWDTEEMVTQRDGTTRQRGWGSIIDLVKRCEGMNYKEAESFILARANGDIAPTAQPHAPTAQTTPKRMTDEAWMNKYTAYVEQSRHVTAEQHTRVVSYLESRGLSIDTAKMLGFGSTIDRVRTRSGEWRDIPFLVIPWLNSDGMLTRCVNRRNLHTPLPDDEEKYMVVGGSEKTDISFYMGQCLLQKKRPTFLVESELDAATVLQEAGDLVNVVATGSAKGCKNALNASRLHRQPFVFVAFDDDDEGEKASTYWIGKLDAAKSVRYRPLMHDANEMHTCGRSVRQWVMNGLHYVAPGTHHTSSAIPLQGKDAQDAPHADNAQPNADTSAHAESDENTPCYRCGGTTKRVEEWSGLLMCECYYTVEAEIEELNRKRAAPLAREQAWHQNHAPTYESFWQRLHSTLSAQGYDALYDQAVQRSSERLAAYERQWLNPSQWKYARREQEQEKETIL